MPQIIYPDTNALSYLLWPLQGWTEVGIAAARQALVDKIRRDEIIILGSQYHIEEASRISADRRRQFIDLFWDLIQWALLLTAPELNKLEVRLARPLTANEPFDTFDRRQRVRRFTRNNQELDAIGKEIAQNAAQQTDENVAFRQAIIARFAAMFQGLSAEQVVVRWWATADARLDEWMQAYLEESHGLLGLSADQATWPPLHNLQTLRAMMIYQMARAFVNIGLHMQIGDGDRHDGFHYAGACYAHIFVTQDNRLRQTLGQIPGRRVQVMQLAEFTSAVLAVQPH